MNHWTLDEDQVIRQEFGGLGWRKRAMERLPNRSLNAVKMRAHTLGLTEYAQRNYGSVSTYVNPSAPSEQPFVGDPRPPSMVPLRDRIPDFMLDLFVGWGVARENVPPDLGLRDRFVDVARDRSASGAADRVSLR
jgi:hypothetical protein